MNEYLPFISNLFKKYGVKSIAMDDIAKEFGMSKKTLYKHFENKDDVILKVAQYEINNEFNELDKLCNLHSNAIDQLLFISRYMSNTLFNLNTSLTYDLNKYYPQIWGKLINQRKQFIHALIIQNFQTGVKQGIYRKNINTNILADFYTYLFDIKGFEKYKDGFKEDFNKMFNTLFMYHMRGIVNNNGKEHLEKQFSKLIN